MTRSTVTETEHTQHINAPANTVYRLLADVEQWPAIFPPTVHVDLFDNTATDERIRICATANGGVHEWTSRRQLDAVGLRIRFRQEVSRPPVAAMGGEWIVEPTDTGCLVRLLHDFRAVDDAADAVDWISKAVDRNSTAELAALAAAAEHGDGNRTTFDDTVTIAGDPAEVYQFIYRAEQWSQRLPHVARVVVDEQTPGLQTLEMDTRTADGATHTTVSVRVCRPNRLIAYKQLQTPALMSLHTGQWIIEPSDTGCTLTSRHTIAIAADAIPAVLGPAAAVAEAAEFVRKALGHNSRTTMAAAKAHAESAAQVTDRAPSTATVVPLT